MEHYDWNDGWLFTPVFDPAIVRPECPELTLEPVRLPHTVKALPYNYCNENDYQKLSGYRREFFAPKEWEGRTVLLTFGAVAHDATVFCNGRRVFHHSCGYTAFTVDLTSALHLGQKNVVAVRCDSREDLNIPPFRRRPGFFARGAGWCDAGSAGRRRGRSARCGTARTGKNVRLQRTGVPGRQSRRGEPGKAMGNGGLFT